MTLNRTASFPQDHLLSVQAGDVKILPAHGRMRVPVRIFASARLQPDQQEIDRLEQIAALQGVSQLVALPDLHIKPHLEAPSSLAVAAREYVVLSLSSPSPGCGMALASTQLKEEDLSNQKLDAFFSELSNRLLARKTERILSTSQMQAILSQGAAAVIDLFGLDPGVLSHMDRGGNALASLGRPAGPEEIQDAVPPELIELAVQEFGQIGRGNHFLEVQVVEEILDTEVARSWGVQAGQVLVLYHADSGKPGALTGRLYAFRQKNTPRGRWIEMRMKTRFHLSRALGLKDLARRGRFYFSPQRYVPVPASSVEGRRALVALGAAANYAFANRLAIYSTLQNTFGQVWGLTAGQVRLLWDSSHNSIRLEGINGEELWIHRHNASPALPPHHPDLSAGPFALTGQPVLLPGTQRHISYLCAAGSGVADSLFSVPHGAGKSAERLDSEGARPGQFTRLYSLRGGLQAIQSHRGEQGIQEVLTVLKQADLARPVARLRPVAVVKDMAR